MFDAVSLSVEETGAYYCGWCSQGWRDKCRANDDDVVCVFNRDGSFNPLNQSCGLIEHLRTLQNCKAFYGEPGSMTVIFTNDSIVFWSELDQFVTGNVQNFTRLDRNGCFTIPTEEYFQAYFRGKSC